MVRRTLMFSNVLTSMDNYRSKVQRAPCGIKESEEGNEKKPSATLTYKQVTFTRIHPRECWLNDLQSVGSMWGSACIKTPSGQAVKVVIWYTASGLSSPVRRWGWVSAVQLHQRMLWVLWTLYMQLSAAVPCGSLCNNLVFTPQGHILNSVSVSGACWLGVKPQL